MFDLDALGPSRSLDDLLRADRVILFGAGSASREIARFLRDQGRTIAAFVDNDPSRAGTRHLGVEVLGPDALDRPDLQQWPIVVSTEAQGEVGRQLLVTLGIPRTRVFPQVSHMLRSHYQPSLLREHAADLDWLLGRVADAESRRYLEALITVRWTMDPSQSMRNPKVRGQYLYDEAATAPRRDSVIVDCGAYTGDTARDFLARLDGRAQVYALEPFDANYALLAQLADAHPAGTIVPLKCAAGAAEGTAVLSAPGEEPSMYPRLGSEGGGGTPVPIETLDRLFRDQHVDYLKMDIEGGEMDALRGAAGMIARDHPTMVIASYHRADDLWAIPQLVEQIAPGFRLYAGHNHGTVHEVEFYFVFD